MDPKPDEGGCECCDVPKTNMFFHEVAKCETKAKAQYLHDEWYKTLTAGQQRALNDVKDATGEVAMGPIWSVAGGFWIIGYLLLSRGPIGPPTYADWLLQNP